MTHLKTPHFALSLVLASAALAAVAPAHAQPMMGGGMGAYQEGGHMHERMSKEMDKHQADLKAKLHLAASQEAAWATFVQSMAPPTASAMKRLDRDELAKLTTPERLDKMNAAHEANSKAMNAHIKQRTEATREFYSHLSAEQQKVFDTETMRGAPHMGRRGKTD